MLYILDVIKKGGRNHEEIHNPKALAAMALGEGCGDRACCCVHGSAWPGSLRRFDK